MSESVDPLYRLIAGFFGVACLAIVGINAAMRVAAQDAAVFVAGGRMLAAGDLDIYPKMEGAPVTSPTYDAQYCALVSSSEAACESFLVPFVSPPPMLIPSAVVGALPGMSGVYVLCLLGALTLGIGGFALWRWVVDNAPVCARPLAGVLILLVPFAQNPLENGQNAPWLFAAAVAGAIALAGTETWAMAVVLGGLLAACTVAKASPILLVGVLLWARYWRSVGVFAAVVGALGAASLLWIPGQLWADHAAFLPEFSTWVLGFKHNTSIDAAVALGSDAVGVSAGWIYYFTRIKAVAVLAVVGALMYRRVAPVDVWLVAWAGWLVMNPINWWHYNWLIVAALFGVIGVRLKSERHAFVLAALVAVLTPGLSLVRAGHPSGIVLGATLVLGTFAAVVYTLFADSEA